MISHTMQFIDLCHLRLENYFYKKDTSFKKLKIFIFFISWIPRLLSSSYNEIFTSNQTFLILALQLLIIFKPGIRLDSSKRKTFVFSLLIILPLLIQCTNQKTTDLVQILAQAAPSLLLIFTRSFQNLCTFSFSLIFYHSFFLTQDIEGVVLYQNPEQAISTLTSRANSGLILSLAGSLVMFLKLKELENRLVNAEKQTTYLLGSSHEMRNCVNNIIGNINMSLIDVDQFKITEYLKNAKVCGDLLLHLVNNILDTGKMSVGELEVNQRSLPIYSTLSDIWRVCSVLIMKKGLCGTMYISKDVPEQIETDPYRLTQIIFNLVSNALKFTAQGSISITVDWVPEPDLKESAFGPIPFDDEGIYDREMHIKRFDNKYVPISATTSSKSLSLNSLSSLDAIETKGILKISVHDTGCGMAMDKLDKLFKRFSQVSDNQMQREIGTGLGLFITKELSHKMGGDVKAFSKAGTGTCFITCLPTRVHSS